MVALLIEFMAGAIPPSCAEPYEALRYRDALTACTLALATASPNDRSEIYLVIGLSHAATGDAVTAQRVFAALLATVKDAQLPSNLSPKLREPFELASKNRRSITLSTASIAEQASNLTVSARANDGATDVVTAFELRRGARFVRAPRRDGATELTLIGASQEVGPVLLAGLDLLGGEVASVVVPLEAQVAQKASTTPLRERSLFLTSPPYWVAAGLGAVLSVVALVWSQSAYAVARSEVWADDAFRVKTQGDGALLAAGIGALVTVGLVGTGVAMGALR
jgi:hypothetical protein